MKRNDGEGPAGFGPRIIEETKSFVQLLVSLLAIPSLPWMVAR